MGLVHAIRTSDNLEDVAESVSEGAKYGLGPLGAGAGKPVSMSSHDHSSGGERNVPGWAGGHGEDAVAIGRQSDSKLVSSDREPTFESELSQRMSQLRVDTESGQVRFIGGTSNLILLPSQVQNHDRSRQGSPNFGKELERSLSDPYLTDAQRNPLLSWSGVLGTSLQACEVIDLLLNM